MDWFQKSAKLGNGMFGDVLVGTDGSPPDLKSSMEWFVIQQM
jgi:hypothetical protein